MPRLTPAQKARQKEKLAEFHEKGKEGLAPTSAGSIKPSRSLGNLKIKLSDLIPECTNVIKQATTGGLVAYRDVWKGTEQGLVEILEKDPSASLEDFDIQIGTDSENQPILKTIKVLVTYAAPDKNRIETAKWTFAKEADLTKAMSDSKLKKVELAMKKKQAEDSGALPKEDPQEKAKALAEKGEHIKAATRDFKYNPEWDEEPTLEDEDE